MITLREGIRAAMAIGRQPARRPHPRQIRQAVESGLVPASDCDSEID